MSAGFELNSEQLDSSDLVFHESHKRSMAARQSMIEELQKAQADEEARYQEEMKERIADRAACERYAFKIAGKPAEDPERPLRLDQVAPAEPDTGAAPAPVFSNWAGGLKTGC